MRYNKDFDDSKEETMPEDYYPEEYQEYYEAEEILVTENGLFEENLNLASQTVPMPYRLFCIASKISAAKALIDGEQYSLRMNYSGYHFNCKKEDKEKLEEEVKKYEPISNRDPDITYLNKEDFEYEMVSEETPYGIIRKYSPYRAYVELYRYLSDGENIILYLEDIIQFAFSMTANLGKPKTEEIYKSAKIYFNEDVSNFLVFVANVSYIKTTTSQWIGNFQESLSGSTSIDSLTALIATAHEAGKIELTAKLLIFANTIVNTNKILAQIKEIYPIQYYEEILNIATICSYG